MSEEPAGRGGLSGWPLFALCLAAAIEAAGLITLIVWKFSR